MTDTEINVRPSLVRAFGANAAVMIAVAVEKNIEARGDWFPMTAKQWHERTGLTKRMQGKARPKIRHLLKSKRAGNPCTCYFLLNLKGLGEFYATGK